MVHIYDINVVNMYIYRYTYICEFANCFVVHTYGTAYGGWMDGAACIGRYLLHFEQISMLGFYLIFIRFGILGWIRNGHDIQNTFVKK